MLKRGGGWREREVRVCVERREGGERRAEERTI